MKIKLIDLDGCIADDRWRRCFINPEPSGGRADPRWQRRFDEYHACAHLDVFVNKHETFGYEREGADEGRFVVLTGRPVLHAQMTRNWLWRLGLDPLHVLHRNNDDHRPSPLIKLDQLNWLLSENCQYCVKLEDIAEAIDDVAAIVEMYEANGVRARVVRVGEEEHIHG